ncbi:MAG TPA: hypothetical protein VFA47_12525 [Candidatus Manganitrophaceae bacterium]|nr:hypothetical protein [Candidatus Manganitrophaceae bacterium]
MLGSIVKKSLLIAILMGVLSSGAALAQQNGTLPPPSQETLILERRLDQLVQEKARLEEEMRVTARLVVPPYREYLLLQKSVHFADLSARLNRLNQEGEEVAHLLVSRREPIEGGALKKFNRPLNAFPAFSGSPPLSNIEASRAEESFFYRPVWAPLFRLALYALLIAIVSFPLAALIEMFRRRKRLAPVIQLPVGKRAHDQEFPKEKAA